MVMFSIHANCSISREILSINRRYKNVKRKVSKHMQEQRKQKAKDKLKFAAKLVGATAKLKEEEGVAEEG